MTGRTIAHYEILEKLGEGGMGVVYKARDTHLDRFVAIKVLPPQKMTDAERKRRFVQEAKAASALNHPNIITIHDIDQTDGIDFISMEYVAGQTLDRLIPRHGMRLGEFLKYAIQIADALARAHAAGIIHRDLKPGNIMVTEQGLLKVLDFGLAKLTETAPAGENESTRTMKPATEEGKIVGTVAYMSPEQAEGKPLDARSDIFSFGSVLYEMVTGRRAFQRESKLSTLSAVLRDQPAAAGTIKPDVPHDLETIINRCLRKDPNRRFQYMADVRIAIEELKEQSDSGTLPLPGQAAPSKRGRWAMWAVGVGAVLALAGVGIWMRFIRQTSAPAGVPVPVPLTSYPGLALQPTFSPDGNEVAFCWNGEKQDHYNIFRKLIGLGAPLRLTTDPAGGYSPAWSLDGRFIAFFRDLPSGRKQVCLIPALGGPEKPLAEVRGEGWFMNYPHATLAWAPDGRWLIVPDWPGEGQPFGLFLISVDTGEKRRLTSPDYWTDEQPALSPDGHTLAFVRNLDVGSGDVYLLSLKENFQPQGEPERLTYENRLVQSPVWTRDGKEIVFSTGAWWGERSIRRIAVKDRDTRSGYHPRSASVGEDATILAISPSGRRLAYARVSQIINIYRIELSATAGRIGTPQRAVASTRVDWNPDFSPDGKRITFTSTRSGSQEIWVCDADGSNPRQMTSMGGPLTDNPRWSPDGKTILFDSRREGPSDLYVVSANGGSPRRLTKGPGYKGQAAWSRDSKWIYFESISPRSGRTEIDRMPAVGGDPIQVTKNGGSGYPVESADGKWVYFLRGEGLWKVAVDGGQESRVMESLPDWENYAVVDEGVYFKTGKSLENANTSIAFFDFASGKTKLILQTGKPAGIGLAISRDKRSILFTQVEHFGSDLMLVENFQ